ncbi:MAG: type IV pilus secretin PilQ, partial [Candidatus Binatia bacterium]
MKFFGKTFRFKIWPSLISLLLAGGLIGCTPGVINQEGEQESATTPTAMAAQVSNPTTEKPNQPPKPIKEAVLEDVFKVKDIRVIERSGQTTIYTRFSQPVTQYRHFTLSGPPRIVLDVFGDVKRRAQLENFDIDTRLISNVRISFSEGYLRVVAEVTDVAVPAYVIEPESGGLKMIIGPINRAATEKKDLQLVKDGRRTDSRTAAVRPSVSESPEAQQEPLPPIKAKDYTGQRISLDFKDADIKNVFRLLAEVSGLNIVVTDDVARKVTVRLVDVPWDQAMDILLDTNGLGSEQVGNVVRISSVGRLRAERDAIKAAQDAEENLEPLKDSYVKINYAKVEDLKDKVREVLSNRGKVITDERTNTLVIRDIKKNTEDAHELVRRLDTRTAQILIESNLIETTPSFARSLGFDLDFDVNLRTAPRRLATLDSAAGAGAPFAGPLTPSPLGLTYSVILDRVGVFENINATLTAAEAEGNLRIISRPSVVTLNNVESTIQSLRIVRITLPTGTTNIASGPAAAAGAAVATESVNIGITLSVTPQVSSDGFVLLNIGVKSSSIATNTLGGTVVPFDELSREAISNVLIKDGETVVIGGIMKDTRSSDESGVPYLKDIPVIGWLFKRFSQDKTFEELMVFITPRILEGGGADLPT